MVVGVQCRSFALPLLTATLNKEVSGEEEGEKEEVEALYPSGISESNKLSKVEVMR